MTFSLASGSSLLIIVGALIATVNIVVEVVKKSTWDKIPTNALTAIISVALTVIAAIAYCQINAITIAWYMYIAFVIGGLFVAYGSMYGFDKLKETLLQYGVISDTKTTTDTTTTDTSTDDMNTTT